MVAKLSKVELEKLEAELSKMQISEFPDKVDGDSTIPYYLTKEELENLNSQGNS